MHARIYIPQQGVFMYKGLHACSAARDPSCTPLLWHAGKARPTFSASMWAEVCLSAAIERGASAHATVRSCVLGRERMMWPKQVREAPILCLPGAMSRNVQGEQPTPHAYRCPPHNRRTSASQRRPVCVFLAAVLEGRLCTRRTPALPVSRPSKPTCAYSALHATPASHGRPNNTPAQSCMHFAASFGDRKCTKAYRRVSEELCRVGTATSS